MLRATVGELVEATQGQLILGSEEHVVSGVVIDSREVSAGSAFIALAGERTDGHEHVLSAIERGAHALIVTRPPQDLAGIEASAVQRGAAIIVVEDAVAALSSIAASHRSKLDCRVVGVTGSSGKTTTKDMLASVLSATFRTVSTTGNRNNEIGLPLTVLSAGAQTDVLVVEMGMRGVGQIAALCAVARPTHGLVTNVGTSHIEILGDRDAIADAKGELVASIPREGSVCLNGDDEYSQRLAGRSVAPVTYYGLGSMCAVSAEDIVLDEQSLASFVLVHGSARIAARLGVPGRHNVYNALAASAVALELGVSLERIVEGLRTAPTSGMRMESFLTASGLNLINDAYNANPASMAAAVDTLAALRVSGRRIAVLGDMAELGSLEELAHFKIGEQVAAAGIEILVTVGERALRIHDGARAAGMPSTDSHACANVEEALEVLGDIAEAGDSILVKASRVMGLEAVVEGLVNPGVR